MRQPKPKLARPIVATGQTIVRLELNTAQIEIVNRLYATGLFGNTPAKVVMRLLCDGMLPHAPKEVEKK